MLQLTFKKKKTDIQTPLYFCECLIRMWFSTTSCNFNTVRKRLFLNKPHIMYFILSLLHNAKTEVLFSLLSVNKTFPELFNSLTNSNHFCFYLFSVNSQIPQGNTIYVHVCFYLKLFDFKTCSRSSTVFVRLWLIHVIMG